MTHTAPNPATSAAAFEALYRKRSDPWDFASSPYEQQRYQAILAALLQPAYRCAYEPGCSIGELTVRLAPRCASLLATDIAPTAVAAAQARCAAHPQVRIELADVATARPAGVFDLIVFSELGYYFSPSQLKNLMSSLLGSLAPDGEFIAVHWLGHSADHVQHGNAVHEQLIEHLPLPRLKSACYPGFRIDGWRRLPA